MDPHEQSEYCEVVVISFTETEIENLEIYANHMFDMVERGITITLNETLILDTLAEYGEEGREDE